MCNPRDAGEVALRGMGVRSVGGAHRLLLQCFSSPAVWQECGKRPGPDPSSAANSLIDWRALQESNLRPLESESNALSS